MAKITELDPVETPIGTETVVVVDVDGETKRAQLDGLVAAAFETASAPALETIESMTDTVASARDVVLATLLSAGTFHLDPSDGIAVTADGHPFLTFESPLFRVYRRVGAAAEHIADFAFPLMHLPDQSELAGSMALGDGLRNLSHTNVDTGRGNLALGIGAGLSLGTGRLNTLGGLDSGKNMTDLTVNNTYGGVNGNAGNTFYGAYTGVAANGAYDCTLVGTQCGLNLTTGMDLCGFGINCLQNIEGGAETSAFGHGALQYIIGSGTWGSGEGHRLSAFGDMAGRYLNPDGDGNQAPKTGGNASVYIGARTSSGDNAAFNENVFGYEARGGGSNTMVFGNGNITFNRWHGRGQMYRAVTSGVVEEDGFEACRPGSENTSAFFAHDGGDTAFFGEIYGGGDFGKVRIRLKNRVANTVSDPIEFREGVVDVLQKLLVGASIQIAPSGTPIYSANESGPAIYIKRTMQNEAPENEHGIIDKSTFERANKAYGSIDVQCSLIGTNNFDHMNAFQARPTYSTTGTTDRAKMYQSAPSVTAGTLNTLSHFHAVDAVGAGAIGTQYGFYLDPMVKASTNWALYSAGAATPSYIAGALRLAYNQPITAGAATDPVFAVHATTSNGASIALGRWSADGSGPSLRMIKSRGPAVGGFGAVQSADALGGMSIYAADSAALRQVGALNFRAAENFTTTAGGTSLSIQLAQPGSFSLVNALALSAGTSGAEFFGQKIVDSSGFLVLRPFTVAAKPAASLGANRIIIISNPSSGNARAYTSDGTNWYDGAGVLLA